MLPPLVIREAEVDDALVRLEAALEETASGGQG
jgi:acetylornithine/succinyldiaminopimelate/putrescine aminotransferase